MGTIVFILLSQSNSLKISFIFFDWLAIVAFTAVMFMSADERLTVLLLVRGIFDRSLTEETNII